MSIKYSLALMSTKPGDDTAKKMYYAKAQADGRCHYGRNGGGDFVCHFFDRW